MDPVPFGFVYGVAVPIRAWARSRRDGISFTEALDRMAAEAETAAARKGMFLLPDGSVIEARVVYDRPDDECLGPLWELRLADRPPIMGRPLNRTLAELLGYAAADEKSPIWVDILAERIQAAKSL